MDGVPRRVLQAATEAAIRTEGIKRYKLGAVLYDNRGHVITAKGNSRKTHPILAKYSPFPFLHAESACILAHGLDNCSGLNLFVLRIGRNLLPTMAHPCTTCLQLASDVGLGRITYTDWSGNNVLCSIHSR